ncbi:MAG: hypothetical protein OEY64_00990 [Nitrospinota bacterium]|nr:hypothetical protein [Nitrospinota bacterium]
MMDNPAGIFNDILITAMRVSTENERIRSIFERSGVILNDDMTVKEIEGDPMNTLSVLMSNLSEMAVVKISAKQVIRQAGITLK